MDSRLEFWVGARVKEFFLKRRDVGWRLNPFAKMEIKFRKRVETSDSGVNLCMCFTGWTWIVE